MLHSSKRAKNIMRASFWYILEIKKNLGLRGVKTTPRVLYLRRKSSHNYQENPRTHPYTGNRNV